MISDTRKQSNQKELPSFLSWWRRRAVLERRFQVLYALVVQKKGLGTRRLMVWFTYTSVILLITLTIMLLVLPVVLPPLPPPPAVLMFLPLVILICLLVIALVPTGFNGVVVGYMWSILLPLKWYCGIVEVSLKELAFSSCYYSYQGKFQSNSSHIDLLQEYCCFGGEFPPGHFQKILDHCIVPADLSWWEMMQVGKAPCFHCPCAAPCPGDILTKMFYSIKWNKATMCSWWGHSGTKNAKFFPLSSIIYKGKYSRFSSSPFLF